MIAKFRGKRIDNGEWVYGHFIAYRGKSFIFTKKRKSFLAGFVEVHPDSVGMFTGLKDKKGVEIYEGDIIEFNCGRKVETAVIEYQEHCYHAGFFPDKHTNGHMHWEVIGNTTDNPELLKEL